MFKKILFILFFIFIAHSARAATLSLSPASGSHSAGEEFLVDIFLDTQGEAIDGLDIHYLNYDPSYLEVIDSVVGEDTTIQISDFNLMPITQTNSVNPDNGKITFSQITSGGNTFISSGAQKLASVNFKVKKSDSTSVYFSFVSSGTSGSSVTANGMNILTSVINGEYGQVTQKDFKMQLKEQIKQLQQQIISLMNQMVQLLLQKINASI